MAFGLNLPGAFQRMVNFLLPKGRQQFSLVYLDDIVTFLQTLDENIKHVGKVLSLKYDTGVTLKLKKCNFLPTASIALHMSFALASSKFRLEQLTIRRLEHRTAMTELQLFWYCMIYSFTSFLASPTQAPAEQ